jgi:hypothetical protein
VLIARFGLSQIASSRQNRFRAPDPALMCRFFRVALRITLKFDEASVLVQPID